MSHAVHVYCGPTISAGEVREILPRAVTHPPARHGDLLAESPEPGDTVILIDGVFFQAAPVRHKEILHLLATGVQVAGAASMGALRAAELCQYGMTGVGRVFAGYQDGTITDDDEVAVACTPDGLTRLSEAMTDIRCNLTEAAAAAAISACEAQQLAAVLKAVHYPSRTWAMLQAAAPADLQPAARRLREWAGWRGGFRSQKADDARQALEMAAAGELPPPPAANWARSRSWESIYLRDWLARFTPARSCGPAAPMEMILRHQQLHDPGFPARWRRHVLTWLAGGPQAALDAAAAGGISVRRMTPAQTAYWLTAAEVAALPEQEQLARILVRSMARDMSARIWPATPAEADSLISRTTGSGEAVAAARDVNELVAARGPQRTIWHLREDLLRSYLARLWGTGDGTAELTAAARDRGFATAAAAVEAARYFYLLQLPAATARRAP